jgi:small subunit ribosomal protein S16
MVRIRLRRVGAKHQPSFRIVAADKESPRDGRFLEILGHYNPRTEPATIDVDEARLYHWLKTGAQPSDSALHVLQTHGAWGRWERFKQGEAMEALLEEAKGAKMEVDPRTDRVDMKTRRQSKKARAKAEASESPEAAEAELQMAAPEDTPAAAKPAATETLEAPSDEPASGEPPAEGAPGAEA